MAASVLTKLVVRLFLRNATVAQRRRKPSQKRRWFAGRPSPLEQQNKLEEKTPAWTIDKDKCDENVLLDMYVCKWNRRIQPVFLGYAKMQLLMELFKTKRG